MSPNNYRGAFLELAYISVGYAGAVLIDKITHQKVLRGWSGGCLQLSYGIVTPAPRP